MKNVCGFFKAGFATQKNPRTFFTVPQKTKITRYFFTTMRRAKNEISRVQGPLDPWPHGPMGPVFPGGPIGPQAHAHLDQQPHTPKGFWGAGNPLAGSTRRETHWMGRQRWKPNGWAGSTKLENLWCADETGSPLAELTKLESPAGPIRLVTRSRADKARTQLAKSTHRAVNPLAGWVDKAGNPSAGSTGMKT